MKVKAALLFSCSTHYFAKVLPPGVQHPGRAGKVCFRKECEVSEVGERPAAIHPGFQGTCRSLLYEVREVTV